MVRWCVAAVYWGSVSRSEGVSLGALPGVSGVCRAWGGNVSAHVKSVCAVLRLWMVTQWTEE